MHIIQRYSIGLHKSSYAYKISKCGISPCRHDMRPSLKIALPVITSDVANLSFNCERCMVFFRAMLASSAAFAVMRCPTVCVCVCLSVCLSRSYLLSKQVNISSDFFHHRVDPSF